MRLMEANKVTRTAVILYEAPYDETSNNVCEVLVGETKALPQRHIKNGRIKTRLHPFTADLIRNSSKNLSKNIKEIICLFVYKHVEIGFVGW